ncbi:hypothetical protein ACTOB_007743 [Actinoplanes oblitus]|uniref:Uncharacterized protein n=1 Tax=Actinoplanes oblitus TaxID=3040509 RepID=A0ABY8WCU4_9ACTN|nr:PQQ-binding-like beta-propeller repeat protein [Actinoplanes oblitus]WIM95620.1 hypothetical protein ACTOB_007743 [Actinoplanes oblitus]
MALIDLGDLSAGPGEPPAPPPPVRRVRRRPAGAALVAVLCALALGAAAVPEPSLVHDAWSVPAGQTDSLATDGDTVYLARATDGRTVLTAYAVATGTPRWSRDLPWVSGAGGLMTFLAGDGMVRLADTPRVAIHAPPDAPVHPGSATVLDAATGAVRWRSTSEMMHATRDTVLLADRDDRGELRTLRLVGARAGETRWTRQVRRVAGLEVDGTRIVTTTLAGDAGVYRYTDGSLLSSGRVAWSTGDELGTQALIHDGRFVVTRTDPLGATIIAYRLSDLGRDWSVRTLRSSLVTGCGPVLCLARGADVAGLEPATGAIRWVRTGQGVASPAGADRLIAAGTDANEPVQTLLDAATGRVLGNLGAGWPDGDLMVRTATTPPLRTVLSRIDLPAGRAVTLGTVESIEGAYCAVTGRFLVCQRTGRIVVTTTG